MGRRPHDGPGASTLASEYGPQWMNMPNLACLNHAVRCSSDSPLKGGVAACWALLTEEFRIEECML